MGILDNLFEHKRQPRFSSNNVSSVKNYYYNGCTSRPIQPVRNFYLRLTSTNWNICGIATNFYVSLNVIPEKLWRMQIRLSFRTFIWVNELLALDELQNKYGWNYKTSMEQPKSLSPINIWIIFYTPLNVIREKIMRSGL